MAFCKECGSDLQGAKFCANCGAAAQDLLIQQRESALSANANMRQASMAECKKMIQYFSQKTKTWEKYDQVSEDVRLGRSRWHTFILILGIVWLGFGCFLAYGVSTTDPVWNLIETVFVWGLFALVFILPCLPCFFIYSRLDKKSKKKYAELQLLQDVLSLEIFEHYEAYGYCHVGLQYTRVGLLQDILKNIDDGRCSTIDAAINILLDDEYKRSMQQQAEAIHAASERAADAAEEAAAAAKASLLYDVMDHL